MLNIALICRRLLLQIKQELLDVLQEFFLYAFDIAIVLRQPETYQSQTALNVKPASTRTVC